MVTTHSSSEAVIANIAGQLLDTIIKFLQLSVQFIEKILRFTYIVCITHNDTRRYTMNVTYMHLHAPAFSFTAYGLRFMV